MINDIDEKEKLQIACDKVRKYIKVCEFEKCNDYLNKLIGTYPHSPIPHNLYGLLLEKEGNHSLAMKHIRAAWSLEPTYLPARYNLEVLGTFTTGQVAYDESDCPGLEEKKCLF